MLGGMNTADIARYAGPVAVTLCYLLLYYAFMGHVARVKARLSRSYAEQGKKFDRYFGEDREMLAADRVQLNTLEQMPPFLVLLWLNATFVSPSSAAAAGWIYVISRALYPVLMGRRLGRGIRARQLASTVPGYLVLIYYMGTLGWALAGP